MGVLLNALLLDVPERFETPRLHIRATRAGHGAMIHEAFMESHPQLRPWLPWAVEHQGLEHAERHCREMQARWHSREEIDFVFLRRGDGSFVGKGGLHTIDWTVPKFEIGYWIRTSCAGQGFATEATQGLVELARSSLSAHRMEICSDARNLPSRRVAEKCGFELEGIHRLARRDTAGELSDACTYARVFR
ncbi:MAG: GNAT family N-acetyltransferase [Usitatibacter sp.]